MRYTTSTVSRNHLKMLAFSVIPPDESAWKRGAKRMTHTGRKGFENLLVDSLALGKSLAKGLEHAQKPTERILKTWEQRLVTLSQREIRKKWARRALGAIVLLALVY